MGKAFHRAFVAIEINDEVRAGLQRFQEKLKRIGVRVSWVPPPNIHLTLVFLGDVSDGQIKRLQDSLDRLGRASESFSYGVSGAGFFGSARSPRVIWAGVPEVPPALMELQAGVEEAASGMGVEKEKRGYKPHITLGRVRGPRNVAELTSMLASANNTRFGVVHAGSVVLMKSELGPQGASYTKLHEASLKGAQTHAGENESNG